MKSYYFTLLLILLFTSSFVTAQQNINDDLMIRSVEGKKYQYQNKIYTKRQLKQVLVQDPVAAKYYRRYQTKKVSGGVFFGVSGGLALTSYSYLKQAREEEHDPQIVGGIFRSLLTGVLSLGAAGVGVLSLGLGSKNFHQSIQSFNGNVHDMESLGVVPMQLNFQSTQNGVGLVLNF